MADFGLLKLTQDIIFHLISYANPSDILSLAQTCSTMTIIASTAPQWSTIDLDVRRCIALESLEKIPVTFQSNLPSSSSAPSILPRLLNRPIPFSFNPSTPMSSILTTLSLKHLCLTDKHLLSILLPSSSLPCLSSLAIVSCPQVSTSSVFLILSTYSSQLEHISLTIDNYALSEELDFETLNSRLPAAFPKLKSFQGRGISQCFTTMLPHLVRRAINPGMNLESLTVECLVLRRSLLSQFFFEERGPEITSAEDRLPLLHTLSLTCRSSPYFLQSVFPSSTPFARWQSTENDRLAPSATDLVAVCRNIPSLRKLHFRAASIDISSSCINQIGKFCSKLQELSLDRLPTPSIAEEDDDDCPLLPALQNLEVREQRINHNPSESISSSSASSFASLMSQTSHQLQRLTCVNAPLGVTPIWINVDQYLPSASSLSTLNFTGVNLSDLDLHAITLSSFFHQIKSLAFGCGDTLANCISDRSLHSLAASSCELERLEITRTSITEAGLLHYLHSPNSKRLRSLSLKHIANLTSQDGFPWHQPPQTGEPSLFDLAFSPLYNEAPPVDRSLLNLLLPNVTELVVQNCGKLSDNQFCWLLSQTNSVRYLTFGGTALTSSALAAVHQFAPSVHHMEITESPEISQGLESFMCFAHLTSLALSVGRNIPYGMLVMFGLACPKLQLFRLFDTRVEHFSLISEIRKSGVLKCDDLHEFMASSSFFQPVYKLLFPSDHLEYFVGKPGYRHGGLLSLASVLSES